MPEAPHNLPKMMLGFVVRRCTVDLGRLPSPAEFALWANNYANEGRPCCLFGRPISDAEAEVILKHRGRLVSAKSAAPDERYVEEDEFAPVTQAENVVSLADARKRRLRFRKPRRNGSGQA